MPQYFFILGHNPTFSIWEISSLLDRRGIKFKVEDLSSQFFRIETDHRIRPAFLEQLGGTVRIVELVKELKQKEVDPELFIKLFPFRPKAVYGFSIYPLDAKISEKGLKNFSKTANQLGLKIKKELRRTRKSVRFVTGRELVLSSVAVEKENLLRESGEWVFFVGQNKLLLGRTVAVQLAGWYSWRDYGRPERDARAGMLPPKLAKILINLAGVHPTEGGVILDPFCGSGTIIQEAGILGFNKLMCFDVSSKAISQSKKNWQWMEKKGLVIDTQSKLVSFGVSRVEKISKIIPAKSVEAIVSEGHLGSPMTTPSLKKIQKLVTELSELYIDGFGQFKKILTPKGRVVITMPVFRLDDKQYTLPVVKQIRALGFKPAVDMPEKAKKSNVIQITERKSVIYGRPDQMVWREVFVWRKT